MPSPTTRPTPETAPASTRVRIAVAVNRDGEYVAYGNDEAPKFDQPLDFLWDYHLHKEVGEGPRYVWVEVDVPLPVVTTVEGTVTNG